MTILKLNGKTAVVTGGSSGIGLAAARRLVDEGAYVFITGRRESELRKAQASIGRNVSIIQGDVTDLEDLDRLFEQVKAEKGVIDMLIASAGFVEHQTIDTATPEHFDGAKGIAADDARRLDRPGVVRHAPEGLSGAWHLRCDQGCSAIFARTGAMELKDRGIRVNSLSPGAIDTPIIDGQFRTKEEADGARDMFAGITPLGRIGRADEMASAIFFLASNESSYSTGIDLIADGGITQL
jgi:NAD(P)-dependent dehydrogenase (short-subunit alcohol dehydrogenase family)